MTRRPARTLRAALLAGLTALVAGCGPLDGLLAADEGAAPGPTVTAEPTTPAPAPSPAVPGADAARADGTPVTVDGTTVAHVLPVGGGTAVRVEPQEDVTALVLDPGGPTAAVDVLVAAPAGANLLPQEDGGIVVLAADGAFVGGTGRPLVGPGTVPARLVPEPDGALRLRATGPVTLHVGVDALLGADWGNREGGRSLAVEPSPWARGAGQAGEVGTWTELVRAVPEADTPTMRDQLTCHALGAPDKATWNLEPWRPDVGLLMTLAASCNAS